MYTFKVFKNNKELHPISHNKSTSDKIIAYEIWDKMQLHYEHKSQLFGYSYSISMFKDNVEIQHLDYEY